MARPVVGVCAAVDSASYGPWDGDDVAIVPATMVAAVQELGWLAVLLPVDRSLVSEPDEVLRLLDGLIVPDWEPRVENDADFSRTLGAVAENRGLPVMRLPASLLAPESTVADYSHAIARLFSGDAPGLRIVAR